MKIFKAVVVTTLFLVGCQSQHQKTKSGMPYKIISGGGKQKIKQGQFVKFNYEYRIGEKDSVLNTSYGHAAAFMPVDTSHLPKYNFTEIITELCVGDKAEFTLSIDTLKRMGLIPEYNKVFKKGANIKGKVEVLKVYNSEKDATADFQAENQAESQRQQAKREKEMGSETKKEQDAIAKFINSKGLKTTKTPSGVYIEIQNEGSPKADTGKQVSVMYRGYLLDGTEFDANMGKSAKHTEPFNLVLGQHSVIPGWEEGLKYFGKGGKGRLIIPFELAYGPDGRPPVIPAYSPLVFDIEVLDVTNPPAQTSPKGLRPNK